MILIKKKMYGQLASGLKFQAVKFSDFELSAQLSASSAIVFECIQIAVSGRLWQTYVESNKFQPPLASNSSNSSAAHRPLVERHVGVPNMAWFTRLREAAAATVSEVAKTVTDVATTFSLDMMQV